MEDAARRRPAWGYGSLVALALALHAALLATTPGLRGGADLVPHLALIEQMRAAPGLRNTYAPAYHGLGALFVPTLGLDGYVRAFAFAAAVALLAGFEAFRRAARLPAASTALFATTPYLLALTHCAPKVEAAGYALALAGLACLLRGRAVGAAALLGAAFWTHTAAALFLGLTGGVLCLARRDVRGLVALAAGTLLASPLVAAHLRAGCTLAQALLFSEGDYLRARPLPSRAVLLLLPVLAGPIALVAAAAGRSRLWRHDRAVALVCAAVVALYLNELWLAPLGRGTTLTLLRGLSVLAIPLAAAGGLALDAARPRVAGAALGLAALGLVASAGLAVPRACYVRSIDPAELRGLDVARCTFRWRGANLPPREPRAGARSAE
jgi:hypothetical protein